jgi:hypothetical protein
MGVSSSSWSSFSSATTRSIVDHRAFARLEAAAYELDEFTAGSVRPENQRHRK